MNHGLQNNVGFIKMKLPGLMKIVYIFFFLKAILISPSFNICWKFIIRTHRNIILLLSLDCAYNVSFRVVLIKEILVFNMIR